MFRRYTERAQQTIVLAQDEARRLRYGYVGTEHLLLGLIRLDEGPAIQALRTLGVDPATLRGTVETTVGPGNDTPRGEIGFTPGAKKVMVELAMQEAYSMGHNYIGTEHILLGLLRETDGVASQVLAAAGVELERLRAAIREMLGVAAEAEPPAVHPSDPIPRALPILPLTREVRHVLLPLASEEAARLGAGEVGPEHLLLGLLRDAAPAVATAVLQEKGITLEWLRRRLAAEQPPPGG